MKLTKKQKMWLNSRAGRNETDVFESEGGLYVFMYNGEFNRDEKVYLPVETKKGDNSGDKHVDKKDKSLQRFFIPSTTQVIHR